MASLRMRLMVGDLVLKVGRVMVVIVRVQENGLLEGYCSLFAG